MLEELIMTHPKVSIVIPVYNVEKFLVECLESAINQTMKEIEIICVDDGSTDNCANILDSYAEKDSRIKVIHKTNAGYGAAMNTGLDAATGEYFSILESDDFFMIDTCEILYRTAKEFDADIVRSDYFDYTTKYGKVNLVAKQMTNDYSYYYRLICPNKEKEVYTFVMHNWTGIYKMSYLKEKQIRYNETPGASYQDNGFFFQTFSQTERLVYVPRPFYCYRIDNPASSINSSSKVYTMAEEYSFIRTFLSNHQEFEQELLPVFYARMFRAYHQTYLRIAPKYRKEFAEFFHNQFIEVKNMKLIDTGYYTKQQRILLSALLESPEVYDKTVFKVNKESLVKRVIKVLKQDGIIVFLKKCKVKIERREI